MNRPAGGILALAGLLAWTTAQAGEPVTGPVIDDFGPVYAVPDAALGPPALGVMRVVFDVVEDDELKAMVLARHSHG